MIGRVISVLISILIHQEEKRNGSQYDNEL